MDVLLIRHAKAEERESFALTGADDALRPLTKTGTRQMRRIAEGLHSLVPRIDAIASSPLLRAQETAEILAATYGRPAVPLPPLAPGHPPSELLLWLRSQGDNQTVALVGHEPDLGLLASWLLTGGRRSFMTVKKGGACLIRLEHGIKGGGGVLAWLLSGRQLRELGD